MVILVLIPILIVILIWYSVARRAKTAKQKNIDKKEHYATVAFILSIISTAPTVLVTLLNLFGIKGSELYLMFWYWSFIGFILPVFSFIFALKGLKSSKRNLALISIIIDLLPLLSITA